jgi:hypothetical protein
MKKRMRVNRSTAGEIKRIEKEGLYGHTLYCIVCGSEIVRAEELDAPDPFRHIVK